LFCSDRRFPVAPAGEHRLHYVCQPAFLSSLKIDLPGCPRNCADECRRLPGRLVSAFLLASVSSLLISGRVVIMTPNFSEWSAGERCPPSFASRLLFSCHRSKSVAQDAPRIVPAVRIDV
jgi:hypothetical protein